MTSHEVKVSKFLSFVLRHHPEEIGLILDDAGWASVADLSPDGTRIRAHQGHSIRVELGHDPLPPPRILYHGTARHSLPGIREKGLLKRNRHHVHLSETTEAATKVGQRHGEVVVLGIQARGMARDGYLFFQTPNKVWLVDHVPPQYVVFPD